MMASDSAAGRDRVAVVIECRIGQAVRTRIDHGTPEVVRSLPAGVVYPANYGYAEGTRAADGEAIDVFVLGEGLDPLARMEGRVVAAVEFWDARGEDEKLIALPIDCSGTVDGGEAVQGAEPDNPDPALAEALSAITRFLEAYKPPEAPHRVGRVLGPRAALGLLERARQRARNQVQAVDPASSESRP